MAAVALVPGAAGGGLALAAGHPAGAQSSPAAGVLSTVAGGVGGPAKATRVGLPSMCGVAFAGGSLYAGDGSAVRKVSQAGRLTTPAGTGLKGPPGDGGPADRASVFACGVAFDHSGNLVIADERARVRVVAASTGTFYGQAMTARDIYTVAGNGKGGSSGDGGPATKAKLHRPHGVAVDGAGNLLIADTNNNRIRMVGS